MKTDPSRTDSFNYLEIHPNSKSVEDNERIKERTAEGK